MQDAGKTRKGMIDDVHPAHKKVSEGNSSHKIGAALGQDDVMQALKIDFQDLFDQSLDGIFIHDFEGNLLQANPAALAFLGYEKEDVKTVNFVSILDREDRIKALNAIAAIVKTGYQHTLTEYKLKHKNGTDVYIETKGSIIYRDRKPGVILGIGRDITERKKTEALLRQREQELKDRTLHCEEMNTALGVLIRQREKDKADIEEKIMTNMGNLIDPYIAKLKDTALNDFQKTCLDLIESGLKEIVSPFLQTLKSRYAKLTPTEIRIANMIREGKNSKEIGRIMDTSERTVEFHRYNIRMKLDVLNKKVNLRTYLLSLE
jgi:PAS domain S-box-containing protein